MVKAALVVFASLIHLGSAGAGTSEAVDSSTLLQETSRDINGDGVADAVQLVVKGDNRVEAVDGATGKVLWRSSCHNYEWGRTNRAGRLVAPLLVDINDDGLRDFVFAARGCDEKGIVALDHASGRIVWRMASAKSLGRPALWDQDFVLEGSTLLVGVLDEPGAPGAQEGSRGVLLGVSPRDGAVLWRARIPLPFDDSSLGSLFRAFPDPSSSQVHVGAFQHLKLAFDKKREVRGGETAVVYGPRARETRQIDHDIDLATPLEGLADTARAIVSGGRMVFAGEREVRAIDLSNGSTTWVRELGLGKKRLIDAAVLLREGRMIVFGWAVGRSGPAEALLVALELETGKLLWQRSLDLAPVPLSLRLGEQLTLATQPATAENRRESKKAARLIVIDPRDGKVESDSGR